MTDDTKTLASQIIALSVLKRQVAALEADLRERGQMAMDRGDRKAGYAGGAKIGTVTLTDPAPAWRVVNGDAFRAWVKANRPEEIVTVESVNSAFEKALLAGIEGSGEIPDGVDLVTGATVMQVRPAPDAAEAITAELAREGLTFSAWLDSFTRPEIESPGTPTVSIVRSES